MAGNSSPSTTALAIWPISSATTAATKAPASPPSPHDLGGRVAVLGYSPWNRLGNSAKRSQMLSLADWISGGKLPILIPRTVRVTPLVRQSADGKRLAAVLLNTSFDPTGPLELIIRAPLSRVRLLTPRGETALAVKPQPDGICVALPDLLHWNVAVLAGDAPMA